MHVDDKAMLFKSWMAYAVAECKEQLQSQGDYIPGLCWVQINTFDSV
jgi:hypothetical protein